MSDPHFVWDELHALLARLEDQKKQIYVHYQDLVGAVLMNHIVSEREIEAIMDGLLEFFSGCNSKKTIPRSGYSNAKEVTAAMIYVMSDIHGNMRRFNSVMQQINLQPDDTLYVLGDVIDRHPDGIRILRKLMAMPNVKMLLGNHEYMMLRAIGRPFDTYEQMDDLLMADATRLWYRNGGKVTHSYWKHIRKDLREEIIQYLHSLYLNYDVEVNGIHYKLVHGAPTEEYENFRRFYLDPTHFSVWKRWRIFEEQHGDYTVIFGHTPTLDYQVCTPMEIWHGDRKIGIDCGSGYPEDPSEYYSKFGRLACLRLDDMKEFYSEERQVEDNA